MGASRSGQGPRWAGRLWRALAGSGSFAAASRLRHSGVDASRVAGRRVVVWRAVRVGGGTGLRSQLVFSGGLLAASWLPPGRLRMSRLTVDRPRTKQTSEAIQAHARRIAKHASSQRARGCCSALRAQGSHEGEMLSNLSRHVSRHLFKVQTICSLARPQACQPTSSGEAGARLRSTPTLDTNARHQPSLV